MDRVPHGKKGRGQGREQRYYNTTTASVAGRPPVHKDRSRSTLTVPATKEPNLQTTLQDSETISPFRGILLLNAIFATDNSY